MKRILWSADVSGLHVVFEDDGLETIQRTRRNKRSEPLATMQEQAQTLARQMAQEFGVRQTEIIHVDGDRSHVVS